MLPYAPYRQLCALFLLALALTCPLAANAEEGVATVKNPTPTSRLNLRAAPSADAEVLMQYYSGVQVKVLDRPAPEWVEVSVGADPGALHGFMASAYLVFEEDEDLTPLPVYAPGTPWTLFAAPAFDAATLARLKGPDQGAVLGLSKHWLHVCFGDLTGFVPNPTSPATPAPSRQTAIPTPGVSPLPSDPSVLVLREGAAVYEGPGGLGAPLIVLPVNTQLRIVQVLPQDYAVDLTGTLAYLPASTRLWTDLSLRAYEPARVFHRLHTLRETKLRTGPGDEWPALETLAEDTDRLADGSALTALDYEEGWHIVCYGRGLDGAFPLIAYVSAQDVEITGGTPTP